MFTLAFVTESGNNFSLMEISKILSELHAEMAAIDEALVVLERLAGGRVRPRTKGPAQPRPVGAKRKPFSAETRKRMALAQKRRWASVRKSQKAAAQG